MPTLSRQCIRTRAEPLATLIDYGIDFNKVEILVALDDVITGRYPVDKILAGSLFSHGFLADFGSLSGCGFLQFSGSLFLHGGLFFAGSLSFMDSYILWHARISWISVL
jgi:hypothetical protein